MPVQRKSGNLLKAPSIYIYIYIYIYMAWLHEQRSIIGWSMLTAGMLVGDKSDTGQTDTVTASAAEGLVWSGQG